MSQNNSFLINRKEGAIMANKVTKILTREANETARNTSEIICCGCKECISDFYCYAVDGLKGYTEEGKQAFFHITCINPVAYHAPRRENITGIPNTTLLRLHEVSLEVEVVGKYNDFEESLLNDKEFADLWISLCMLGSKEAGKSQQGEYDCTVTGEHHSRGKQLYSFSKWIHNRSEEAIKRCLDNDRCGCHIHATCNYTFSDDLWFEIFNPLFQRMKFKDEEHPEYNEEKMIEYFGRTFSRWAEQDKGFHGDAINWHTNYNTIEWRLPRIRTADQIVQCAKFWKACVNVVNSKGHKVHDRRSAAHLGRLVEKQFDRLLNGSFAKGM